MNLRKRKPRVTTLLLFMGILLLSGCASAPSDDQEGGISGTGNDVRCAKSANAKNLPCPPRE